eukprot:jgi/Ulvmu1/8109/UM040_0004.1
MTISSANLLSGDLDEQQVLSHLTDNLATPVPNAKQDSPAKSLQPDRPAMKEDVAPGTGRHSAAGAVLQLRAELHRTKLDAAATKADLLRLLEHAHAQRDEARQQALGLQAALEAHLRAEAERLAATPPAPPRDAAPAHTAVTPRSAAAIPLHASQDEAALLSALAQPLGFHRGRPVAALLIFRCCVHWGTLDTDRSALVERIVTTIGGQADAPAAAADGSNSHLCYWLSNAVTLLLLLQAHVKTAPAAAAAPMDLMASARSTLSMLAGQRRSADASTHHGSSFVSRYIASRRPGHVLGQALADCVDSLLTELRDRVKHAVQTPLALSIHAPGPVQQSTAPAGAAHPWAAMLAILQGLHEQLAANEVPLFLRRKLFLQLFSFINVQLFNQLLLRRECCSFANGEYVKQGLASVEEWLLGMGAEVVGESWEELKYIRQAVNFLVLHAKQKKTLDDIQQNLCAALSVQQLYRISTMYWDDKFGTETVSPEVLQQMREVMQRHQGSASHSFLLDDVTPQPFSALETQHGTAQHGISDAELCSDMPLPEPLQGSAAFAFLRRDGRRPTLAGVAQP